MNGEAMLAGGYAIFLIAVAGCLEAAARHSHRRSERMPLAGFRYDSKRDYWTCPQEQRLVRRNRLCQARDSLSRAAARL